MAHIFQQAELHLPHLQHHTMTSLSLHNLSHNVGFVWSWAGWWNKRSGSRDRLGCIVTILLWHSGFPFSHPSKLPTDTSDTAFKEKEPHRGFFK